MAKIFTDCKYLLWSNFRDVPTSHFVLLYNGGDSIICHLPWTCVACSSSNVIFENLTSHFVLLYNGGDSIICHLPWTCVACSSSNVIFENLSVVSLTFSHWAELIPSESISIIMFTLHFTPIIPCSQVCRFSKNVELQMLLHVAWRSIISFSNSATVKIIRHVTSS